MKSLIAGLPFVLLATAAMAQTVTPAEPPPAPHEMTATPDSTAAPAPALTKRDGKWWNGDREATPAEIEAFTQAQQKPVPQ